MQLPKLQSVDLNVKKKKKILLLSDDLRMSSGVGTMSREFVMGTVHHFDWVQIGGAIKHPEEGKIVDMKQAIKDELKIGRSFNFATEKAVKEAWNTILVADFVSIIAAIILYLLAVGPIRGFALTLGLATVFDLFYTRMFISTAVPVVGNITDNPRFYFPLNRKDIENV